MLKHDGSGIGPRIFHLSPTEWTTATILVSACLPQRRRQKYLKYHHLAQQPQAQLGFDDFESVNMVRYLPISDQCLGEIRAEPREDQFLQELSETILVGWPEHKDYTPAMTHPYFSMRDEVTVQDGFQRKLCCNPLEPSRRHEDEDSLIPPWNRSMSAGCTWMRVLKKSIRAGTDPYLTILDYRNTPTQGMTTSPEQRLMSQRAKTLLPTTQNLLLPRTLNLKSERKNCDNASRLKPNITTGQQGAYRASQKVTLLGWSHLSLVTSPGARPKLLQGLTNGCTLLTWTMKQSTTETDSICEPRLNCQLDPAKQSRNQT